MQSFPRPAQRASHAMLSSLMSCMAEECLFHENMSAKSKAAGTKMVIREADRVQKACLKMANARGLVSVMQAIKSSSKDQMCIVVIKDDGVSVRWEDKSKSLQSSVWLNSELFSHYGCPWVRRAFGLHFGHFVDMLNVFALGSGAELVLRFPGPDEELICEMTEDGAVAQLCTQARIATAEVPFAGDLMDAWQEPTSHLLMSGALLKEAVDDLEWASGGNAVRLALRRDPPAAQLSVHGSGDLNITLPAGKLDGFHCAAPEVRHAYKHKHMKTAFSQLPQPRDGSAAMSSKVLIDANGLMKVTHMLGLGGGVLADVHFGAGGSGAPSAQGGMGSSQRAAVTNRMAVIQFMLVSEDEYDEEAP